MNKLQIFLLMQNQVMEIRHGMKLTRSVTQAKVRLKAILGLPKRTSNLDLLQHIGYVYADNNWGTEFNDFMASKGMWEMGIEPVAETIEE